MYNQDWFMRQIEMMVQFIVKIILGKNDPEYQIYDEVNLTYTDLLHIKLLELLSIGKINEAENLLFDSIQADDNKYLEVAVDFYTRLNRMTDSQLEYSDFSREEIDNGFKEIKNKFNILL